MPSTVEPLPRDRRHRADYRDDIEHAEVAQILSELPDDHPARIAYCSAAVEAASSIRLGYLLTDRMDLVERLTAAYMGHSERIWDKYAAGNAGVQPGAR